MLIMVTLVSFPFFSLQMFEVQTIMASEQYYQIRICSFCFYYVYILTVFPNLGQTRCSHFSTVQYSSNMTQDHANPEGKDLITPPLIFRAVFLVTTKWYRQSGNVSSQTDNYNVINNDQLGYISFTVAHGNLSLVFPL